MKRDQCGWWIMDERGLSDFHTTETYQAAHQAARAHNLSGKSYEGGACYGTTRDYHRYEVTERNRRLAR